MEIIKRKNGKVVYRPDVFINGKRLRKTFRRIADAKSWKQRMESDRDRAAALGINPRKEIRYCDFLSIWNERKFGSIAHTTKVRYLGLQRLYLNPFFKGRMIRECSKELIHDFATQLRAKGTPSQTIDQVIQLTKSMMANAVEWEYLQVNPVSKFPKFTKRITREEYWEEAEAIRFLDLMRNAELFPLYFLAIKLGLRRGELAGLKWDVVNFSQNHISVCRVRDRYGLHDVTKTLKKRDIPMNSEVRVMMQNLAAQRKSDFVIAKSNGTPIDIQHAYRAFNRAQKDAGMARKIKFHDLRHTFASIFLMRNGNINALAKIMGHSQVTMTERYGHIAQNYVRSEMEKMASNLEFSPYLAHTNIG